MILDCIRYLFIRRHKNNEFYVFLGLLCNIIHYEVFFGHSIGRDLSYG
jgi:hypothetical protein